uniref:uncharacterized protein At4g22758-like n=1 Tax=Erigeron canadensis TaxID=72917 RepID=UPI001CB9497E|nr:uncharacterized protein At4g22758-like [Erigeron canadensis]
MLPFKMKKKEQQQGVVVGNKILVKINVVGSAGPIRFVVDEKAVVAYVIEIALKSYAREGRLPVLGTNLNDFFLYTPIAGTEALSPWEMIGSFGVRNFMLSKKRDSRHSDDVSKITKKSFGSWKSWFNNRSLSLKVATARPLNNF